MNAAELVGSLDLVANKIRWVKCPFCDDEVTALRPCVYWQNGREQKSHVCVECAESVKGLTYLAGTYPIPGVDVVPSLMPVYEKLPRRYVTERSYKATVTYGNDWGFMVWPQGTSLIVLESRKTPDQKKDYNNTFQVWFAIKQAFEQGRKEEEAPSKGGWKV